MRKVIFVGLFVFAAVVVGGWCVSWYAQADSSKKWIEAMVAKVNEKEQYLTYDSLTTSGFPTHIELTMTNPRLSGRMDKLVALANDYMMAQSQPALFPKDLPEWQEEMKLDGTIKLSVSALSDQYSLHTTGKWVQNSDIGGKSVAKLVTPEAVSSLCSLNMEKGTFFDNMWNFKIFENGGEEFINRFRSAECNSNAYSYVDSTSGATFLSSGPVRVFISNNPNSAGNDFSLYVKYTDAEITEAGEDWIHHYVKMIAPDTFYPKMYAYYGKQSMEIDFAFKGPKLDGKAAGMVPFEVNLAKFDFNSNLYKGSGRFIMKNESTDAETIKGSIDTDFAFEYTKHYDDLLKHLAYSFVKHANTTNDPMLDKVKSRFSDVTPEQAYAMIAPAIPNLSSLGVWKQTVNASVDGKKNMSAGNVNLSNFAFTFTPYGVTGSGTAQMTEGVPFPQANFTFDCTSCTLLVDDLTSYINRVMGVAHALAPEEPNYGFQISGELTQGIKQFLAQISSSSAEENAKGNYKFLLVSDKTGNMTVSGRNFMEVMGLYQQHIMQNVMPQQTGGAQPMQQQHMQPGGNVPAQGWKVQ